MGTLFFVIVSSHSALATEYQCAEFRPWLKSSAKITQATFDRLKLIEAEKEEYGTRVALAEQIFNQYFSGRLNNVRFNSCLNSLENRDDFLDTLYSIFYKESLNRLAASRSPIIQRFVSKLQSHPHELPAFRLVGHFREDKTLSGKAGFHRGTRSIFINFYKVRPEEWLIIFSHELLHSIDQELLNATEVYSDAEMVKTLAGWVSRIQTANDLPPDIQVKLTKWVEAGLSRGLWAEYRAWYLTFIIYSEGLNENLWKPIDWVESILTEKNTNETLDGFLYRFLSTRFDDPNDGIFSLPLIKNALLQIRSSYGQGKMPPPIGNLGEIIGPN